MEINYNVTGPDRATGTGHCRDLESDAKYLGVPSCAYQVDSSQCKDGILSDDHTNNSKGEQLIERLANGL